MSELDELLRATLPRLAPEAQTPSTEQEALAIADRIRERVAAGDAGTPAAGTTAPGWGGGWGAILGSLGAIVLAGVVGVSLGLTGVLGAPVLAQAVRTDAVLGATVDARECVGGAAIATLVADTRVFAIARSDDAAWLGVRDPGDPLRVLWVPSGSVVAHAGTWETLPTGGDCPSFAVEPIAPDTLPDGAPVPDGTDPAPPRPGPPSPGPGDTVAPTIAAATASPATVYNADPVTIVATVTDDVAVASVDITLPGGAVAPMTRSGSQWSYVWSGPPSTGLGAVSFGIRALDTAGNASTASTNSITHLFFG